MVSSGDTVRGFGVITSRIFISTVSFVLMYAKSRPELPSDLSKAHFVASPGLERHLHSVRALPERDDHVAGMNGGHRRVRGHSQTLGTADGGAKRRRRELAAHPRGIDGHAASRAKAGKCSVCPRLWRRGKK